MIMWINYSRFLLIARFWSMCCAVCLSAPPSLPASPRSTHLLTWRWSPHSPRCGSSAPSRRTRGNGTSRPETSSTRSSWAAWSPPWSGRSEAPTGPPSGSRRGSDAPPPAAAMKASTRAASRCSSASPSSCAAETAQDLRRHLVSSHRYARKQLVLHSQAAHWRWILRDCFSSDVMSQCKLELSVLHEGTDLEVR